jgi:DNA-binding NarL/FixJ family response regulator
VCAWKVVIADNHPVFRVGLKIVLETTAEFSVIGDAASGEECVTICKALQPDVVLIDIHMPNGNGVEATSTLHQLFPQMVIIGISAFKLDAMHQNMLRAGAVGLISKETDFERLIEQISLLLDTSVHPLTQIVPTTLLSLTNAEQQVLALLAVGYDRKMVAEYLNISYNTVKMHCRHLYRKLGVSTSQEAVSIALQHRLIN